MKRLTKADRESAAKEDEKKAEKEIILIPKINPVVDIDKWREAMFHNPMYIEGTDEQNKKRMIMVDEKKISKAAREHAVDTWNHEEEQFSCMNGFEAGAHWASQEFKKSLWHDASEEPERYDDYFVKTKQGCMGVYYFDADGWLEPMAGKGNVMMWLDLKDILPKEGGEQ